MAYFPKFGPFYDPNNEQEFYGEDDGRLRLRGSQSYFQNGVNNGYETRTVNSDNTLPQQRKDAGWTGFLQEHGNLFYIESARHTENKEKSRISSAQRNVELNNNHSKQTSYSSDTNGSPRTHQNQRFMKGGVGERQISVDNESLESSGSSLLNERHQFDKSVVSRFNREDRQRSSDGSSQSDHSYTTFSEYLDASHGPPKTSQKRHANRTQKVSNSNATPVSGNQGQSGKRKSVLMVPNVKNANDVYGCSGVQLCEKLFGIKLCNYKDKPPRANGSSIDQILRDRKVIVQGVIQDSQADICNQIHRGDMLVGLNDVNVTWVNIDELVRTMAHQTKVKLTFQVPLVIGPKQSTPPVTPTLNNPPLPLHTEQSRNIPPPLHTEQSRTIQPPLHTEQSRNIQPPLHTEQSRNIPPPLPPHLPLQPPVVPPRQPRQIQQHRPRHHLQDLVHLTTGETVMSLDSLLKKHLFCVLYLTFGNQSDSLKDDVIYQYPVEDNKLIDIRGLFVTMTAMMKDITNDLPKLTCVKYRDQAIHTVYWRHNQDVLIFCLPEHRVHPSLLCRVFSDFIHVLQWQHGGVTRSFEDRELHGQLDQLISLVLYRVLLTGVATQTVPHCSPLEPCLFDLLAGIRWLQLGHDDKILCDEILSEFEAQDFMEMEDVDQDVRRSFGVLGSCLFYKDYLLCSHLFDEDLKDVHLFLKYHAILYLVNKKPVEDLVLWQEIYPSRICTQSLQETPAYKEPKGRWFMLVVGMRHFVHCSILECGGYASQIKGQVEVNQFFLDQSRTTLTQLSADDTDIEQQCNERLFSEFHGPRLKSLESVQSETSPIKSPQGKTENSPRYGNEDGDRLSIQSPDGAVMRRQGSKMSRSSNDSNGSSGSAGINKQNITSATKKGSMYDVSLINRSFTGSHNGFQMKVTRSSDNLLLHYVNFNQMNGVYVSPTPCDLSTVHSPTHEHVLFNFYGCCLRIHKQLECSRCKQRPNEDDKPLYPIEEAVMFTCEIRSQDPKRQPAVLMYWVIGRLFADNQELYVCIEDGAPQTLLELAFNYQFGLS